MKAAAWMQPEIDRLIQGLVRFGLLMPLPPRDAEAFAEFKAAEFRLFVIIMGGANAVLSVFLNAGTPGLALKIGLLAALYPVSLVVNVTIWWRCAALAATLTAGLLWPGPGLVLLPFLGLALPIVIDALAVGVSLVLILLYGPVSMVIGAALVLIGLILVEPILRRNWFDLRRVAEMAAVDPLTGIFNRRLFTDLGTRAFTMAARYQRPISVLTLDIDRFKTVNDTYGHPVGDEVIKMVAGIFSQTMRETDIHGRIGGEEFAAVLPETAAGRALDVAQRLRVAVEGGRVMLDGGRALKVTISIGVTTTTDATKSDLTAALARADKALYAAKEGGRNRVEVIS